MLDTYFFEKRGQFSHPPVKQPQPRPFTLLPTPNTSVEKHTIQNPSPPSCGMFSRVFHRTSGVVTNAALSVACLSLTKTLDDVKNSPPTPTRVHSFHLMGSRRSHVAMCEASPSIFSVDGNVNYQSETEDERFQRTLDHHRSQIAKYRSNWEYKPPSDSDDASSSSVSTSTTVPSRSWPDDIPANNDLSFFLEDLKYCAKSPNFRSDKDYCNKLSFRVAAALLTQFDDDNQTTGFEMLRNLAEKGYPDAMAYYGMCLNEGRANTDPNSTNAVVWLRRCADMYEHPQAMYELGVAFYTGEGVVEDEVEAVKWFMMAAEKNHPAAW